MRGSVCRCPKNLAHGDFLDMRRSAVRMLKMPGLSRGLTSSHESGIDTGASGRHLTENGGAVVYHPDVAAVRVDGNGGEPSIPLESSAWQRVLDLRPARPTELGDGAWRHLLSRDDLEAFRG